MSSIIFNIIPKEQIDEMLTAFHACMNLPIFIMDEEGNTIARKGELPYYCHHIRKYASADDICRKNDLKAANKALELGEAYIFSCHAGMSNIIFPLVNKNVLYGFVLVGPFNMEELSTALVIELSKKYPKLTTIQLMQIYDDSSEITKVEPAAVTQISKLIYYLFAGLITDSRERLVINQKKVHQQSLISESIQMYKTGEHTPDPKFPYEKEQQIAAKLKAGNLEEAKKAMNELIAYLISNVNYDVDAFRNRAIEISAVLSRIAIGSGAAQRAVFNINDFFLSRIFGYKTVDDICYVLQELLVSYNKCMFPIPYDSGSHQVRDAISFITGNFHENITLNDVASQVCLNETYFSRLFHQATGMTFKDYLTKVRIDEAKRLLKNTEYPLLEIAIAIGYNDQSYFSRIFKAKTGMSPSDYRMS